MDLADFVKTARGDEPADLLLVNCRLVNVFNGKVEETGLAISGDRIIGWGDYQARETLDLGGRFVAPGFIDGHIHVESSMVNLREYNRAVVPRGTTTIVTDYHEIANVLGREGILYMIAAEAGLPLEVLVMLPSCVPATPMETAGAELGPDDLKELLSLPEVIGLGEMMNFPGVVNGFADVLAKIAGVGRRPVDGHAPGLSGPALNAYCGAGISSDHECVTSEEAREKLARGMYVMMREGSTARNLAALLPAATPEASRRCLLVSDDRHPADLLQEGHIDAILRKAVNLGLDPLTALRMATLNTVERFGLEKLGALAPGYQADLVVLEDLESFRAVKVMKRGRWVAEDGALLQQDLPAPPPLRSTVTVAWDRIPGIGVKAEGGSMRVIGLVPDQIVTDDLTEEAKVEDGLAVADPARDILKMCVFERHRGTGNVGIGFIKGFGLKRGALASTVAHDSHNIVVVGVSDEEIITAVRAIESLGGGQVVVEGVNIIAGLPLPIAGLMSDKPLKEVAEGVERLKEAARSLGCGVAEPFMALSFMALPVIPSLKLTDKGLFDVNTFAHVPLFV
jgi:adenine deaminase